MNNTKPIYQIIRKAEEEERKELQNSQKNKQNGNRKFTSVNNDLNINTKFSNQTQ